MRQSKFITAVVLTPEEGLAAECQKALLGFGLKKFTTVNNSADLLKTTMDHSYELILVDTDCLEVDEKKNIVERVLSNKNQINRIFVAISRISSREELVEMRSYGFLTVIIKPVSIGIMEQALSEVIERQRTQPIDRESLHRVWSLFLNGQQYEAERTLKIWLEKDSHSLEGLTLLALLLLKKQEYYRANQTIQIALKIKPDYLPALHVRSRICLRLGQLGEAFDAFTREERAVALLTAQRAGNPAHKLNPLQTAELSFCDDFSTREGITTFLINLGLQLSKIGKSDDALRLYQRALGPLEDDEARFIVYFNRGRLLLSNRKYAYARRDLENARQLAPDELVQKIDELLMLCNTTEVQVDAGGQPGKKQRLGGMAIPDLLNFNPPAKPTPQYKPFDKDEVLKLVFLGKMQEETVPPDSLNEWLQMKKRLMHILFLDELPLVSAPTEPVETEST